MQKTDTMIIRIENLVLKYHTAVESFEVLDIPSWQLDRGEQVAISGPSGSGKSTFLNTMAGLLVSESGTVSVCSQELSQMGEAERDRFRAKHIGYIFQTFNLLQGYTAIENVLLGATFSHQQVDRHFVLALLERVGLKHRLHHYPSQMSIGEQQRVAIARALAKKPEIILADEPTGSLDPRHTKEIVQLLMDACRDEKCSLVVVSHETSVVCAFQRQDDFLKLNRAFTTDNVAR
jgi:ABC-type lipoprotein export system ATPase subunit